MILPPRAGAPIARGKGCAFAILGRLNWAMPVRRYGDEGFPDHAALPSVVDDRAWTHRTRRGAMRRLEWLRRDMDPQARERFDIAIYRGGRFEFVVRFERVVPSVRAASLSAGTSMSTPARDLGMGPGGGDAVPGVGFTADRNADVQMTAD